MSKTFKINMLKLYYKMNLIRIMKSKIDKLEQLYLVYYYSHYLYSYLLFIKILLNIIIKIENINI
jgi:hypothetical protein